MTTRQRINRSMLAMAAIAISTSAVASAQYKFTKIDIPGSKAVYALGISNKNEVVGQYTPSQGNQSFGFWRTNDVPAIWHYPLSDPEGDGDYTSAASIDSGRIVVGFYVAVNGGLYSDVGMFLNGGTYSDYSIDGCLGTIVNGINDRGETAGNCLVSAAETIAWLSTKPIGLVSYLFPGASGTFANAINNAGVVVGYYTFDSVTHGYMRDTQGVVHTIDFPGASATYLNGISDTGQISGSFKDSGGNLHGFLYAGTFVQVDVPGGSQTVVNQINKHGRFVGSYVNPGNGHTYGFIAKPIPGASILVESGETN